MLLTEDQKFFLPILRETGWLRVNQVLPLLRIREPDWYQHRMFKGTAPEVNLHVFSQGCEEAQRMLDFRDWLRSHQADRDLYAAEKRRLSQQTWTYVQNYADAKSEVVAEIFRHIRGTS